MRNNSAGLLRRLFVLGCCVVGVATQSGCLQAFRSCSDFKEMASYVFPGTIVNKGRPSYDTHNFNHYAKYKPYPHPEPTMYYDPVSAESVPAPEPEPTPRADGTL